MRTIKTILFLLAIHLVPRAEAQITSKYVMDKMIESLDGLESAHFEMATSIDDAGNTQAAEVWFDGDHSLSKTSNMEVLVTPDLFVTVNHEMKLVQFVRLTDSGLKKAMKSPSELLDSLLRIGKQPLLHEQDENEYVLSMEGVNKMVRGVKVHVDANTFLTTSMQLHYYDGPYGPIPPTRIEFLRFDRNPQIPTGLFADGRYFKDQGGETRGVGKCVDYEVREVPITQFN